MSKVLRIDLQGSWNYQVYEDKEDLRTALIDIHETDMDNEEDKEDKGDLFSSLGGLLIARLMSKCHKE